VPKLAKATKRQRDLGAIKGIRKHLSGGKPIEIDEVRYDAESLVAKYEEHLRAMARVEQRAIDHEEAVAEERELEAKLATIHAGLKSVAEAMMGKHGAGMLDFGIEPDRKPRMSAETKKRANQKRQQTRKERGLTKGKKKRRR
jgi:hypothetical protein